MPQLTVTPLGRRIVVELEPVPERSTILTTPEPEQATLARWATVQSVGPDCREIQPGERVYVSIAQGLSVAGVVVLPEASVLLRAE